MTFKVLKELVLMIFSRRKFFLLPIIFIIFIFGLLLVITQGSVIAPFIYTIF